MLYLICDEQWLMVTRDFFLWLHAGSWYT